MEGRTALVTGANSGVGLETTRALARLGARVVLACRDSTRGQAARRDVLRDAPGADLSVVPVDLASFASVREAARAFLAENDRLDVLVNNAGIHTARRVVTEDGHESTWQTNHLGPFLLTNLLLPALRRSSPSRVVTVASAAHRGGRMRWDDLDGTRRWAGIQAYTQSKLANVLFARELARREAAAGVASYAVHPGSVATGWARGRESGALRFATLLARPFLLSPTAGARTSVVAATAEGLPTGAYLVRGRVARPSRAGRDDEAARRLWVESAKAVGLDQAVTG